MPHYRRRPSLVEAVQWLGEENNDAVVEWAGKHSIPIHDTPKSVELHNFTPLIQPARLWVAISNTWVRVEPGDWFIREPNGAGVYPCKPDIFAAMYDEFVPVCWETEGGEFIVWGTHDAKEAEAAFQRYCQETNIELSLEDDVELRFDGVRYWGDPILLDLEVWDDELYGHLPQNGWEPWLSIGAYL